jgi:heme A synthase
MSPVVIDWKCNKDGKILRFIVFCCQGLLGMAVVRWQNTHSAQDDIFVTLHRSLVTFEDR